MEASAVILAGGQGRRMGGRNKALLPWDRETLIERLIRICSGWTDEIIVVSNDAAFSASLAKHPQVVAVPDRFAGEGPLAGLHAGAAAASGAYIWLLACDQPLASAEAASLLLARLKRDHEGAAAAVPVRDGKLQPLHAVYRRQEAAETAEALLKQGDRKMLALFGRLPWIGVDAEEFIRGGIRQAFTADVDTPEDYRRIMEETREG